METIGIYVKRCDNVPDGMKLTHFELLSPLWTAESVMVKFYWPEEVVWRKVIGWTDLYFGSPCVVYVARVRIEGLEGYLVWGGNNGVRVGSKEHPIGMPMVWIALGDGHRRLQGRVLEVVTGALPQKVGMVRT